MTEGLILAMLVSLALTILATKTKSLPIMFISSLGWLISALQAYEQTAELLPLGLMMMLALGQFIMIKTEA